MFNNVVYSLKIILKYFKPPFKFPKRFERSITKRCLTNDFASGSNELGKFNLSFSIF